MDMRGWRIRRASAARAKSKSKARGWSCGWYAILRSASRNTNWSCDGTSLPISRFRSAYPGEWNIEAGAASGERPALSLIVPEETVWHTATEVSRTLLSPAYGALQPARWCDARSGTLPAETATVFVARSVAIWQKDESPVEQQFEPRLASMAQAAVQVYELDYHDESHGFFFALGDSPWSFGPWSSDARVLYCRIEKEKLAHLVVIGGTYVAWARESRC